MKDFPNAYQYFENEVTLPLHTNLSDEDVEYVIEMFLKLLVEISYFGRRYGGKRYGGKRHVGIYNNALVEYS